MGDQSGDQPRRMVCVAPRRSPLSCRRRPCLTRSKLSTAPLPLAATPPARTAMGRKAGQKAAAAAAVASSMPVTPLQPALQAAAALSPQAPRKRRRAIQPTDNVELAAPLAADHLDSAADEDAAPAGRRTRSSRKKGAAAAAAAGEGETLADASTQAEGETEEAPKRGRRREPDVPPLKGAPWAVLRVFLLQLLPGPYCLGSLVRSSPRTLPAPALQTCPPPSCWRGCVPRATARRRCPCPTSGALSSRAICRMPLPRLAVLGSASLDLDRPLPPAPVPQVRVPEHGAAGAEAARVHQQGLHQEDQGRQGPAVSPAAHTPCLACGRLHRPHRADCGPAAPCPALCAPPTLPPVRAPSPAAQAPGQPVSAERPRPADHRAVEPGARGAPVPLVLCAGPMDGHILVPGPAPGAVGPRLWMGMGRCQPAVCAASAPHPGCFGTARSILPMQHAPPLLPPPAPSTARSPRRCAWRGIWRGCTTSTLPSTPRACVCGQGGVAAWGHVTACRQSRPCSPPSRPPCSHFVKLAAPDAALAAKSRRELEAHSQARHAGGWAGRAGVSAAEGHDARRLFRVSFAVPICLLRLSLSCPHCTPDPGHDGLPALAPQQDQHARGRVGGWVGAGRAVGAKRGALGAGPFADLPPMPASQHTRPCPLLLTPQAGCTAR